MYGVAGTVWGVLTGALSGWAPVVWLNAGAAWAAIMAAVMTPVLAYLQREVRVTVPVADTAKLADVLAEILSPLRYSVERVDDGRFLATPTGRGPRLCDFEFAKLYAEVTA